MEFKTFNKTLKRLPWKNSCSFIIIQWDPKARLDNLINGYFNKSVHFFIDEDASIHKIGQESEVMPHCGTSNWLTYENLDPMSLWIMIKWSDYTDEQKESLRLLCRYLTERHWIPLQNILRLKDITQNNWWWMIWELYTEWTEARKNSPSDSLRDWFETFGRYRLTLHHSTAIPKPINKLLG